MYVCMYICMYVYMHACIMYVPIYYTPVPSSRCPLATTIRSTGISFTPAFATTLSEFSFLSLYYM